MLKKISSILILVLLCSKIISAQTFPAGSVKTVFIEAKSLLGNKGGENTKRRISIYLPPGYNIHTKYPVIYYLHGFTWSDSLIFAADHMDKLLDKAIAQKRIKPFILVTPNALTQYKGSFYTNSIVNGNWPAFVADDLVNYIDSHYSTIKDKNSRGLAGHSMGAHGALKIALLYPDRFCAVYALSPALLAAHKEWMQNRAAVSAALSATGSQQLFDNFDATLMVAVGRAFSPDINKPPFYCDLPFSRSADSLVINNHVLALWNANTPSALLATHAAALRNLKALAFDWGSNDQFKHIPISARFFATQLEAFGIPFTAQEYEGDHGNKIMTDDGRMLNQLLPFFNKNLVF